MPLRIEFWPDNGEDKEYLGMLLPGDIVCFADYSGGPEPGSLIAILHESNNDHQDIGRVYEIQPPHFAVEDGRHYFASDQIDTDNLRATLRSGGEYKHAIVDGYRRKGRLVVRHMLQL